MDMNAKDTLATAVVVVAAAYAVRGLKTAAVKLYKENKTKRNANKEI